MFLCGVNESAYLNKGNATIYKAYQVYNGHTVKIVTVLKYTNIFNLI